MDLIMDFKKINRVFRFIRFRLWLGLPQNKQIIMFFRFIRFFYIHCRARRNFLKRFPEARSSYSTWPNVIRAMWFNRSLMGMKPLRVK